MCCCSNNWISDSMMLHVFQPSWLRLQVFSPADTSPPGGINAAAVCEKKIQTKMFLWGRSLPSVYICCHFVLGSSWQFAQSETQISLVVANHAGVKCHQEELLWRAEAARMARGENPQRHEWFCAHWACTCGWADWEVGGLTGRSNGPILSPLFPSECILSSIRPRSMATFGSYSFIRAKLKEISVYLDPEI